MLEHGNTHPPACDLENGTKVLPFQCSEHSSHQSHFFSTCLHSFGAFTLSYMLKSSQYLADQVGYTVNKNYVT